MTKKSRVRKTMKKIRSAKDVNPQPRNLRAAPVREEEDRDEADRGITHVVLEQARIDAVSFVREGEGSGYVIEVGGEAYHKGLEFKHGVNALVGKDRVEAIFFPELDEAQYLEQDIARVAAGILGRGSWPGFPGEEAIRAQAASHTEALVERTASDASGLTPEGIKAVFKAALNAEQTASRHLVFFEAETNGQPTHIESRDCACGLSQHHWDDQGENN